jgi:hypothetical protein
VTSEITGPERFSKRAWKRHFCHSMKLPSIRKLTPSGWLTADRPQLGRRPMLAPTLASSKLWMAAGIGTTPLSSSLTILPLVEVDDRLQALDRPGVEVDDAPSV